MRPWAEYLAANGYTVDLPRLPGHGTALEDMLETDWMDWSAAAEAASACVDITANRFSSVPGTVIHLAASAQSAMRVIGAPSSDGKAIAGMVASANGGAVAVVEGTVLAAPACH